jgi:hypothetical protein
MAREICLLKGTHQQMLHPQKRTTMRSHAWWSKLGCLPPCLPSPWGPWKWERGDPRHLHSLVALSPTAETALSWDVDEAISQQVMWPC